MGCNSSKVRSPAARFSAVKKLHVDMALCPSPIASGGGTTCGSSIIGAGPRIEKKPGAIFDDEVLAALWKVDEERRIREEDEFRAIVQSLVQPWRRKGF